MACIIKIPTENSKGVVSFTTQERDNLILKSSKLAKKIADLKKNWIIGLHHNWHDLKFKYNPLFDFSMAGEEDLKEIDNKEFPLITMDACNFIPEFYRPSLSPDEKFWDILYIARAVKFKKIPEFFDCIRRLYDKGKKYRILFICPIPPYKWSERKTVFYDIRKVYDQMFLEEEKDFFNLMTIEYRHPFPFDEETLAHFYKSSKIFVHFANNERRCRVAAYAWGSGLPVVGMPCIGSLIPPELRKKPLYYEVNSYEEFDTLIPQAIEDYKKDLTEVINYFNPNESKKRLREQLTKLMEARGLSYEAKGEYFENLDRRLGRHHIDSIKSSNNMKISLEKFVDILANRQTELATLLCDIKKPEECLEK